MADDAIPHTDVLNSTAQGQLKSIIERVERLEVEKAEIMEQIKEVYAEAKGNGFDVKMHQARSCASVSRIAPSAWRKKPSSTSIMSAIGEI